MITIIFKHMLTCEVLNLHILHMQLYALDEEQHNI